MNKKSDKKICYYSLFCDDDLGECYGFFEKIGKDYKCIHYFDCNDAIYRKEYMNRLFSHFGIEMTPILIEKDKEKALDSLKKEYQI